MRRALGAFAVGAVLLACGSCSKQPSLGAGGSSLASPLMSCWAREYEKQDGAGVNYRPVGSVNGVQLLLKKEIDIALIDQQLTEDETKSVKAASGEILHFPLALVGVVPAYNLENVKAPLRFTGPVLANIFLGKITKWDDAAIKAVNPGAALPNQNISVCYYAGPSGTTAIFTGYLSKVSDEWRRKVGTGRTVDWPVGVGCKGSEPPSHFVQKTPGAIGYVEYPVAEQNELKFGYVKNKTGNFVECSPDALTAAAEGASADISDDLLFTMDDAPGTDSYPIGSVIWAVIYMKQTGDQGRQILDFLAWAAKDGQESIPGLHCGRLPKGLAEKVENKLKSIAGTRDVEEYEGHPPLPTLHHASGVSAISTA